MESQVNKFTGHETSSNDNNTDISLKQEWENDFQLPYNWYYLIVIVECLQLTKKHLRCSKCITSLREQCYHVHINNYMNHVNGKMQKLTLGLKSYRYFDQAKSLADKLGVALNEGILNESSSMALSVYSPENLADLLTDKVEQTREEKIAIARAVMQQATVN